MRQIALTCLMAVAALSACGEQDVDTPAESETTAQSEQADIELYTLAAELYQVEYGAAEPAAQPPQQKPAMDELQIDQDIVDSAKEKIRQAQEKAPSFLDEPVTMESLKDFGFLDGETDWTSLVLIKNAKERLMAREALHEAVEAKDDEGLLAARATLEYLKDPYLHYADAVRHFGATGQTVDKAAGAQALLRAAQAGMRDSYLGVANLYATGEGFEQDDTKAALWYLRAVAVNQRQARRFAFPVVRDGIGMTADPALALIFAEHSDNLAVPEAQIYIAKRVIESDPDRARMILEDQLNGYDEDITAEAKAILEKRGWMPAN